MNLIRGQGIKLPRLYKALLTSALLVGCAISHAQTTGLRYLIGVGVADGGETIVSGNIVTDGSNKITPFTIKAGGGTQLRAGAEYRLMDRISVQGSLGYIVSDPMGYNGSLTFTAIPVELMAFFNITEALRVGAGVRKTHAELRGTGVASNYSATGTYTGSAAGVLEAQYLFGADSPASGAKRTQFGLSLRVVNESFTHDATKINGNHYEVGAALYF